MTEIKHGLQPASPPMNLPELLKGMVLRIKLRSWEAGADRSQDGAPAFHKSKNKGQNDDSDDESDDDDDDIDEDNEWTLLWE